MEELIDVLNQYGLKTGKIATRSEVHRKGLWHRGVSIAIIDKNKNILMQQRANNVASFPGYWDISAAGHVSAGQNSIDAAMRELREEIGVQVKKDNLKKVAQHIETINVRENYTENLFQDYYFVKQKNINLENIKMQESEVEQVKLCSIDEVMKLVREKKVFPRDKFYTELSRYVIDIDRDDDEER